MTYSIESLLFKAAAGVVNTAARAANGLLEVMYPPRYDVAHIWEDVPACSVASGGPAPTDPPSGGVADPAAETVNPPDLSAAGSLTWSGWAEPAVLEVLAEHRHRYASHDSIGSEGHCSCGERPISLYDWHEHIAPLIVERIGCDPVRAIAALRGSLNRSFMESGQDMGASFAKEFFPQYQKPSK